MTILVTGGAGYIGTHICVELLSRGYHVVVADNLCNASREAVRRTEKIAGKRVVFFETDVRDARALDAIFSAHPIDTVIHLAGLKAVGESVAMPQCYYENNLAATLTLTRVMAAHGCKTILFSSTATVYGEPASVPVTEDAPTGNCTNPYSRTKWMSEQILTDLHTADETWNVMLLRYFNPIGAHPSGLIGEDPKGLPNNLVPYLAQVAVGKLPYLSVFGNDYDTPDGTCVRDYIHVVDLARGHVCALEKLGSASGVHIFNLGTGRGHSVLEVLAAYERACGHELPYEIGPRRAGDIASYYCDSGKAARELGWTAEYDLDTMCADSWRWQSRNPDGYGD